MSSNLEIYQELDRQWDELKAAGKQDTPAEESLLAEMDRVWWLMTPEERKQA